MNCTLRVPSLRSLALSGLLLPLLALADAPRPAVAAAGPGMVLASAPPIAPGSAAHLPAGSLEAGVAAWRAGDARRAELELTAWLDSGAGPWGRQRTAGQLLLGWIYLEQDRYNLASEQFTRVRAAAGPLEAWGRYYEALADHLRGRHQVAARECEAYRDKHPYGAHADECLILMGDAYVAAGLKTPAIKAYDDFLRRHPDDPREERIRLGKALAEANANPDRGAQLLYELTLSHNHHANALAAERALEALVAGGATWTELPPLEAEKLRARSLRDCGFHDEAWALYTHLGEGHLDEPGVGGWFDGSASLMAWRTRQYDHLAALYAAEYEEKPSGEAAWKRFRALFRGGRFAEAAEVGEAALEAHGRHHRWRWSRDQIAHARQIAGDYVEARAHWDALATGRGRLGRSARWFGAFSSYRAGEYDEAIRRLDAVLTSDPDRVSAALYYRAKALEARADASERGPVDGGGPASAAAGGAAPARDAPSGAALAGAPDAGALDAAAPAEDGLVEDGLVEDGLVEDGLFEDGLVEDGPPEDTGLSADAPDAEMPDVALEAAASAPAAGPSSAEGAATGGADPAALRAAAAADRARILSEFPTSWYAILIQSDGEDPSRLRRGGRWTGAPPPAAPTPPPGSPVASPRPAVVAGAVELPPPRAFDWSALAWGAAGDAPPGAAPDESAVAAESRAPDGALNGYHASIDLEGPAPRFYDRAEAGETFRKAAERYKSIWPSLPAAYDLASVGLHAQASMLLDPIYVEWAASRGRATPRQQAVRAADLNTAQWRDLFHFAGDYHHASRFSMGLEKSAETDAERDEADRLIYLQAWREHVEPNARRFDVDPLLIWGLMRQESLYRQWAISRVGATGIMQIMPSTGARAAHLLGDPGYAASDLEDPATNARYGIWYLSRLMDRFDDRWPMAVAGYNAGPVNVSSWYGPWHGEIEIDDFVEQIPLLETRDYVKKVAGYYAVYTEIYGPEGARVITPRRPAGDHREVIDF